MSGTGKINWIDTFVKESDINLEEKFDITINGKKYSFTYKDSIKQIKTSSEYEQQSTRKMIRDIKAYRLDIKEYLRFLALPLIEEFNEKFNTPQEDETNEMNIEI